MLSFQQIILRLQAYWAEQGCALLQPYDMEVGAGTSHTATFLRALGPEPWKAAYVQPSRRPEGRPLRREPEPAAALLPVPGGAQAGAGRTSSTSTSARSRRSASTSKANDVRFVEDDWENPTLGAWGLGWEVWLNGMEVTQFTYFQQVGGIDCKPITGEITYGLERLAMYLQGVDNVYDLEWTDGPAATATSTTRTRSSRAPTTSSTATSSSCSPPSPRTRSQAQAPDGAAARAAGLRAGAEGGAQLQPARRARRDQRHRARRLHRPHPQPRRAASRRATSTAARGSASRWRRRPGPTRSRRSSQKQGRP